jgi:NAD(P)-dependent dehydrogenase (short-subunit alcohol dehydrogenase family)
MKILLVGATGTLGRSVLEVLRDRGHQVVTASRKGSDHTVDILDPDSIGALYRAVGPVDALASAAGPVPWPPLAELTHQQVLDGLAGKVVSQVELVRQGQATVAGSFTLITGVTSRDRARPADQRGQPHRVHRVGRALRRPVRRHRAGAGAPGRARLRPIHRRSPDRTGLRTGLSRV